MTLLAVALSTPQVKPSQILAAIDSAEIDLQLTIRTHPNLLAQLLDTWSQPEQRQDDPEEQKAQAQILGVLDAKGAPFPHDDQQLLVKANKTGNSFLVRWLARHPSTHPQTGAQLLGAVPGLLHGQDHSMLAVLLGLGADPRMVDDQGNTPLHTATCPKQVRLLLDCGADGRARNAQGQSVIGAWDDKDIPKHDREQMESILLKEFPMSQAQIVQDAWRTVSKSNISTLRRRAKLCRIDLESCTWDGVSAVEVIVAGLMEAQQAENGTWNTDIRTEKRARKPILSLLAKINPSTLAPKQLARIVAAASLFDMTCPEMGASKQGNDDVDEQHDMISKQIERLQHDLSASDRLAGALDMADSFIEKHLVRFGSRIFFHIQDLFKNEEEALVARDENGQMLALRLMKGCTRHLWDPAMVLDEEISPRRKVLPDSVVDAALAEPNSIPAYALWACSTNLFKYYLPKAHQALENPGLSIETNNPITRAAARALAPREEPEMTHLRERLVCAVEALSIDASVPELDQARRPMRL